jgi:hypothetical protein
MAASAWSFAGARAGTSRCCVPVVHSASASPADEEKKSMQALTIAIGKPGIEFFTKHYLINSLINLLKTLSPPNKTINIPDINASPSVDEFLDYTKINLTLSEGSLSGFNPDFQNVIQGLTTDSKPIFTLSFNAGPFVVKFSWTESYHWHHYKLNPRTGRIYDEQSGDSRNPYPYEDRVSSLGAKVIVQFVFNKDSNAWQITVQSTSAQPGTVQGNVPGGSILQQQVNALCVKSHVDEATAQSIAALDFGSLVSRLIGGVVNTIPGSGDLGNGVVYDFSLGDSGLTFPNNDGIQMGVKGGASYQGTAFSGETPPSLPLPTPPADADTHHLTMYVSNYQVDALHWAFFKAGKLDLTITPQDLPDPRSLDVSNYTTFEPSLKPYAAFVMQAHIVQNTAPASSFQVVYVYTKAAMALLQQQLPPNVYQLIQALPSNAYLTQSDLETFLTQATVPQSFFAAIENAGKTTAMVVSQDMAFTLVIQNGQPQQPDIKFRVQRTDVLTGLKLGLSINNTQTLQYAFANASNQATFTSSSVPGFDGATFGPIVWPVTAEPLYAETLENLGKTGVPLPIMQGFQFVFDQAQLSVQDGYVSILADVEFKSETAVRVS